MGGSGKSACDLPASLFHQSRPSFFCKDTPWPLIGPDVKPMVGSLPALRRFEAIMAGHDQPCAPPTPAPSPPSPTPPTPPTPSPAPPSPTPPSPPPSPPSGGKCCWGGSSCAAASDCHQDPYCSASEDHCTGNCAGKWCPKVSETII